ncbi:hypothetical protein [Leucobacter sp. M11]|uniref:hypothetical protein n=1 Tax=Leucobacter sp. M11 TaxID=2993565 RepID=UPI002D7E5C68|nr:hypothetical protein [Leucobacter sp. M11]MEB4614799.1 hypothetical protein [Leucobacter sp. M11]
MSTPELIQILVAVLGITAVVYSWWQSSSSRLAEQAKRLAELARTLEQIGPPENADGEHEPERGREHRERVIDLKAQTRVAIAGYSERIKRSHGSWLSALLMLAASVLLLIYAAGNISRAIRGTATLPGVGLWLGIAALIAALALLFAGAMTVRRVLEFRRHCRAAGISVPPLWRDISGLTGSAWAVRRDRAGRSGASDGAHPLG